MDSGNNNAVRGWRSYRQQPQSRRVYRFASQRRSIDDIERSLCANDRLAQQA